MDDELMDAIVTRLENKLRGGWVAAMRELKDSNSLGDLEAAIASSQSAELIGGIEEAIDAYASDVAAGYVYAGQRAARAIDEVSDTRFRFDLVDDDAVAWMRTTAEDIASDLLYEQQAVARRVVQLGTRRGASAAEIAEDVRGSIGLNMAQVDQVERYRTLLETGDFRRAMGYQLADGRYDAALGRLSANGGVLGPERIDRMVSRYRDNWIAFRADSIALGTAQDATHAGVSDAWEQAVEQGLVARAAVEGEWVTMDDPKVRPSHVAMHGQRRTLGTPFRSGLGNDLLYPGDAAAPVEDTAGCRCKVVTTAAAAGKSFRQLRAA